MTEQGGDTAALCCPDLAFPPSSGSGNASAWMSLAGLRWCHLCRDFFWGGQDCQGNQARPQEWDVECQEGGIPSEHPPRPVRPLLAIPQEEGRGFGIKKLLYLVAKLLYLAPKLLSLASFWLGWAGSWGQFPEEWESPSSSWSQDIQPRHCTSRKAGMEGKTSCTKYPFYPVRSRGKKKPLPFPIPVGSSEGEESAMRE